MTADISLLAERFRYEMENLPYVCAAREGIGGRIKAEPEHFRVEEILPYGACGQGEHVYVTVRRKGYNSPDVARRLARAAGIGASKVGFGGRKDKNALTTQTFSLAVGQKTAAATVEKKLAGLPFEILAVDRHTNKIKTGHVAANRFRILLSGVESASLPEAREIAAILVVKGVPNFYGPQRFGRNGANIERALKLALGGPAGRRPDRFMVSVFQSLLFNSCLTLRHRQGDLFSMLEGDVARKTDTGGIFVVQDAAEANQRFRQHKIVYTGPIYGHKMLAARRAAGRLEAKILEAAGIAAQDFKRLRARGSRRPAIIFPETIDIRPDPGGLLFEFTLPSGAYATVVMREFTRPKNLTAADHI